MSLNRLNRGQVSCLFVQLDIFCSSCHKRSDKVVGSVAVLEKEIFSDESRLSISLDKKLEALSDAGWKASEGRFFCPDCSVNNEE